MMRVATWPMQDEMGNALGLAQFGGSTPRPSPYRAVYVVRFKEVVYVLHAFQKKSPKGIKTAQLDVDLVERRLKIAQQDYEARYGKAKR
jgi:phage-related protein